MTGTCKLNNKIMRGYRRDPVYQAMTIDLAMLGVISKEECEMLIGSGIPSNIRLPDGSAGKLISEEDLVEPATEPAKAKKTKAKVEDTKDTEETQE